MRVTISGGVHGNELIGVYLIQNIEDELSQFQNISIDTLLANPKAIQECRRYIDRDLNRSFTQEALQKDSHIYEYERAKVIKERLSGCDFLIDLHTTTANMGITIVLSSDDPVSNNIAKIVASEYENVKILRWFSADEGAFINTLLPHSITIEVGPVCQGTLDADLFFKTKKVLIAAMRALDRKEHLEDEVECYDIVDYLDFPKKDGELAGMIHPELKGRDYDLLHPGDPIFITFDEKEIFYDKEPLYAAFINEAAYYEKNIALCLCKKDLL